MNVQQAYNAWAAIYDSNNNKTRDLEAIFSAVGASLSSSPSCGLQPTTYNFFTKSLCFAC
jgi:hypothetical protein